MRRRIAELFVGFSAASALAACASTTPTSARFDQYLVGYVHLVNDDGRELFCHETKPGHYDICYTRAELTGRLRLLAYPRRLEAANGPGGGIPTPAGINSANVLSPSSGLR